MIVYYSSASLNTHRFCQRLNLPCVRVQDYASGPYILITPTYADAHGNHPVPKPVIHFLNHHRHNMAGVIGAGNRNFGSLFALAGRVVSHKTGQPLLHRIELAGTDEDVEIVRKLHAESIRSS